MTTIRKPDEYNDEEWEILALLYNVIDPELFINIVDLGLIYDIKLNQEEQQVFITSTLTTRFCPMGDSIVGGIQNAIAEVFPQMEVHIDITFEPPWSYDRLTPEGRSMLQMD